MEKYSVNRLFRLRALKPVHHMLLAFDTEDDTKGNFVYGHVYGFRGSRRKPIFNDMGFNDKKEMAEFLNRVSRCVLVGKNVDYDLCNLEPFIHLKKLYSKSRFVMGWTLKKTKIIDIQNHLDGSLSELMPLVGMKKLPLADLVARCKNDAEATYKLARKIEDWYFQMGSKLNATAASCSLEIFKRRFFKSNWRRKNSFNEFEREAYRGGRVEVFIVKPQFVKSYDVNSMYLSMMEKHIFPDPNTAVQFENDQGFEYNFKKFQGLADATVEIPMCRYPPLPYFYPKIKKLIFPVGKFRGVWTFDELKNAIKHGGKILHVHRYCFYQKSFPYFRNFARWVWEERKNTKTQFEDMMMKKIGNSLYGKFGQRNEKDVYHGKLEDFDGSLVEGVCPYITKVGDVEYLSLTGGPLLNSRHTFVVISAYVSSFARIFLHNEMVKHDVVYCDTDSLKITDKITSSDELGGWKFEGEGLFKAWVPKVYKFRGDLTCKGIPKRERLKLRLLDNQLDAEFKKPYRFREALRQKKPFNLWEDRKKTLSLVDDKRTYFSDGSSQPIVLNIEIKDKG